ncbi:PREDICTED: divergent paired-related homeobox [Propithecus coquereli]|uniref:Divergent-paired related homeobox n=1 Tax=Propithecus coquereli TaxID=379532 RepID=A0A2K6GCF8_PROCO|nr:PREDICTED: divergent paired-related homeobox [Propithecus coquereli]
MQAEVLNRDSKGQDGRKSWQLQGPKGVTAPHLCQIFKVTFVKLIKASVDELRAVNSTRQMHPHRKRTMFTEKQLKALNVLFNENPYPNPSLQREMASKIDVHPTVLQVWFKNHRAKLKKAKCKNVQQKQGAQERQTPEGGVKASPSQRNTEIQPRSATAAYPAALIYTGLQAPSYQLSLYPTIRVPTDVFFGHRIVHFGCCQDPNIYSLYPIVESQVGSPRFGPHVFGCSLLQSRDRHEP